MTTGKSSLLKTMGPTLTEKLISKGKEYGWNHSLSEIFNALIKAGLEIEQFNEFNYSPYPNFENSIETGKRPVVYQREWKERYRSSIL